MTRRPPLRVGFVALTDAAPVIMAVEAGFCRERRLAVELVKMASWPAVRDALLDGALDAAHCLASLPLSVAAGITGRPGQILRLLMVLNTGGQAVTLATGMADARFADPAGGLAGVAAAAARRRLTLAMTYPGGTHDIWLRHWLAAAGVGGGDVDVIPIPPPQMVANLRGATMDGFSVGEPWNALAVERGIGFTAVQTADLYPGLPEKALVAAPSALAERGDEVAALVASVLAACRWLDDPANRSRAAHVIASRRYVNVPARLVEGRLLGRFPRGGGLPAECPGPGVVSFHGDGAVNAPRRGHALWFLAQFVRLGLVPDVRDPGGIADAVVDRAHYGEAASSLGVPVPDDDLAPVAAPLDGEPFDPSAATDARDVIASRVSARIRM